MTTQASEVRASHILVKTEEEASKLKEQIEGGKDFGDLAAEHSLCPSGAKGGDLGFFGPGRMVPEFDQAAFSLPVGQVSQPIQTQFGWHIMLVTESR